MVAHALSSLKGQGGPWGSPLTCDLLLPPAGPAAATCLQLAQNRTFGFHNGQIALNMRPKDASMRRRGRSFRSACTQPEPPSCVARRDLRVSALARRVAAAYGDANMLPKKAKMHDSLPFSTCPKKTPSTKKMRI